MLMNLPEEEIGHFRRFAATAARLQCRRVSVLPESDASVVEQTGQHHANDSPAVRERRRPKQRVHAWSRTALLRAALEPNQASLNEQVRVPRRDVDLAVRKPLTVDRGPRPQ